MNLLSEMEIHFLIKDQTVALDFCEKFFKIFVELFAGFGFQREALLIIAGKARVPARGMTLFMGFQIFDKILPLGSCGL